MMSITKTSTQGSPAPSEAKAQKPRLVDRPWARHILPFIIGGSSGCVATTCLQPVDTVKVRIQLAGEGSKGAAAGSPFAVARAIATQEGPSRLWAGLTAGYLRQMTYSMLRLGFFDRFMHAFELHATQQNRAVTFRERAIASLCGGGLAAGIANPAEVALVRMQSDGMKTVAERANYRSVIDALARIARSEGIQGLWSGSYPTIIRAMSTNFGQLAFFSESKAQLEKRTNLSFQSQTIAACSIAGFFASLLSLPFDFLKTRLQRGGVTSNGQPLYTGMLDCAVKVLRDEGPFRFYRGFGTYFVRIAPHTMVTLFVADNIHAMIKR